jgi:hypothetical protein
MKISASPSVVVVFKRSLTFGMYIYVRVTKITSKLERYVVHHVSTTNYISSPVKLKPKA